MPGFNKVMLIGNLTRDPQLKFLPSQTAVTDFGLATNRKYRTASGEDKEEVCFVDCSAFGKQAEVINEFCRKGKMIFVEGRLKFDSWEDKVGGGKRSKVSVVVENFQFLGSRDDADHGGPPARSRSEIPRPTKPDLADRAAALAGQRPRQGQQEPPFGEEQVFSEPDIPFAWEGRNTKPA